MTDVATVRRMAGRFAGPVTTIRPFGGGHINETFLAETPVGDLVIQRLNTTVFSDPEAVTANILIVHRHLRGAMVPEPVATSEGQWLVHDVSGCWRAWHRVPGANPESGRSGPSSVAGPGVSCTPKRPDDAAVLFSAGSLLGRFHARLADLDPGRLTETLPGFHDPGRRLDALRAVIAADPCGRVSTGGPEIEAALADEALVDVAAALAARVPRRVAHFDAKLDNVLFRGDEAVCLVDLDTLMPGAWFWDIGDLLRSGSAVGAEDDPDPDRAAVVPHRYQAILDGYRAGLSVDGSNGPTDPAEFEAAAVAGAVVTYEQAVRFLTDWLAGDVYYRISHPTQNLDRARAQLRLLASMPR